MSEGNHLRLVRAFTVDEHIRKSAQWDSARLVSSLDVGYLRADTGNIFDQVDHALDLSDATMRAMTSTAQSVLEDALKLPEEDRAEIATRLIASLDAESDENREAVQQAWAAEIERRCEVLDAGTAKTQRRGEVRRAIGIDLLRK